MISQFVLHHLFFPRPIVSVIILDNRPFPSCPKPLFQGEAKCEAIYMKMIFYSSANKDRFHKKGRTQGMVWKWRFWKLKNGLLQCCSHRLPLPVGSIRELKHWRRRRWRRKVYSRLLQTFSHLFHLVQFVKWLNVGESFGSWIIKDVQDRSSGKEKESRCLKFTSSTKRD